MSTSEAAAVFQAHRDELGFVNEAQCREKQLFTAERDGTTVGAALCNHCVRKPQTTLYELAVLPEYRREGIGRELVARIALDSPHTAVVAKCPVDLPANQFYQATGWRRVGDEDGKNRALNVWEYDAPEYDLITTGRPDLTERAAEYGILRGSRMDDLSRYDRADVSLNFLDLHWTDPDPEALIDAAERHTPRYIVAGDYGDTEVVNDRARQLRDHAENIIIVPHSPGEVGVVPEWAVVGYSVPSAYAGTEAPIWEYRGRDIHVLGGTPHQQRKLLGYLGKDVVSLDCNSYHKAATIGAKWWRREPPHWHRVDHDGPDAVTDAYERSLREVALAFGGGA